MAEIIKMPRLSDTMEEGNIISWLKKVGDKIEVGDILAEVETDKATMDLESFNEGTLLYIGKDSGTVPVDEIIAIIGEKGEDVEALLKSAQSNGSNQSASDAEPAQTTPSKEEAKTDIPKEVIQESKEEGRTKISPLAKKMANELSIPIANIKGSGDGGRIVKKDILKAKEEGISTPSSSKTIKNIAKIEVEQKDVEYGNINLSQMRKTIAKRLSASKFTSPHFYLTIEVDMGNSMKMRKQANEANGFKISFNDIIVKAAAIALNKHPNINASWHDTYITVHEEINIGVAVAINEGLVVPVIKNADLKPMSMISKEIRELAGKARERTLKLDQMQGNTFTISNLGMFGIDEFTAIINPPDSCILAVSSIVQKPIIKNNEVAVGNIMKLTLSCDHRIVDGATGAKFMNSIKLFLENPLQMLI